MIVCQIIELDPTIIQIVLVVGIWKVVAFRIIDPCSEIFAKLSRNAMKW
jgi:hypothetical protein